GRQIGVEIILAVEHRGEIDPGVEAQTGLHRLLDAEAVDHRQHAGKSRVDGRDLGVGFGAEGGRSSREQLGLRGHMGVDFEPDHHLPLAALALDHGRHALPAMKWGLAEKPAALSMADPTRSTVASSKARPITCKPSGRPSPDKPAGTEMPGSPAKFTGTVKTSFRYMAMGSSIFSPMAKAAEGAVGVRIASQRWKAWSKSRAISARTFCAFR